ncbi:hypothetical protein U9M48_008936 [Paspalum notatum var. saurae]|uniref:Uncharacterized protein n=1 Tax=Paspalum notatum var. saurae TaxID=547442 RepID=A0AAQ3SQ15_PASNO
MKKMKYKIYNNINIIEYGDIIGESSNSECQHDWVREKGMMKKEKNINGTESYVFSLDNKLRIFPPSPQPGLYISFEEVIMQKAQAQPASISFMKYLDISAALEKARRYLGADFYIEPLAKAYIQSYKGKKVQNLIYPKVSTPQPIKAESSSSKPSYKQLLQKNIYPIEKKYLEWKMIELLEQIGPQWKKDIKREEVKIEMKDITANIKKEAEAFIDENLTFPSIESEDEKNIFETEDDKNNAIDIQFSQDPDT